MLPSPWTPDDVGRRLIDAFRLLPGRPVMSSARGFTLDGAEVEPFGWPERFVLDVRDRRLVMTWARCQATGESFSGRCRDLGWASLNPERRRRAALATIAAGLNRDDPAEAAA